MIDTGGRVIGVQRVPVRSFVSVRPLRSRGRLQRDGLRLCSQRGGGLCGSQGERVRQRDGHQSQRHQRNNVIIAHAHKRYFRGV